MAAPDEFTTARNKLFAGIFINDELEKHLKGVIIPYIQRQQTAGVKIVPKPFVFSDISLSAKRLADTTEFNFSDGFKKAAEDTNGLNFEKTYITPPLSLMLSRFNEDFTKHHGNFDRLNTDNLDIIWEEVLSEEKNRDVEDKPRFNVARILPDSKEQPCYLYWLSGWIPSLEHETGSSNENSSANALIWLYNLRYVLSQFRMGPLQKLPESGLDKSSIFAHTSAMVAFIDTIKIGNVANLTRDLIDFTAKVLFLKAKGYPIIMGVSEFPHPVRQPDLNDFEPSSYGMGPNITPLKLNSPPTSLLTLRAAFMTALVHQKWKKDGSGDWLKGLNIRRFQPLIVKVDENLVSELGENAGNIDIPSLSLTDRGIPSIYSQPLGKQTPKIEPTTWIDYYYFRLAVLKGQKIERFDARLKTIYEQFKKSWDEKSIGIKPFVFSYTDATFFSQPPPKPEELLDIHLSKNFITDLTDLTEGVPGKIDSKYVYPLSDYLIALRDGISFENSVVLFDRDNMARVAYNASFERYTGVNGGVGIGIDTKKTARGIPVTLVSAKGHIMAVNSIVVGISDAQAKEMNSIIWVYNLKYALAVLGKTARAEKFGDPQYSDFNSAVNHITRVILKILDRQVMETKTGHQPFKLGTGESLYSPERYLYYESVVSFYNEGRHVSNGEGIFIFLGTDSQGQASYDYSNDVGIIPQTDIKPLTLRLLLNILMVDILGVTTSPKGSDQATGEMLKDLPSIFEEVEKTLGLKKLDKLKISEVGGDVSTKIWKYIKSYFWMDEIPPTLGEIRDMINAKPFKVPDFYFKRMSVGTYGSTESFKKLFLELVKKMLEEPLLTEEQKVKYVYDNLRTDGFNNIRLLEYKPPPPKKTDNPPPKNTPSKTPTPKPPPSNTPSTSKQEDVYSHERYLRYEEKFRQKYDLDKIKIKDGALYIRIRYLFGKEGGLVDAMTLEGTDKYLREKGGDDEDEQRRTDEATSEVMQQYDINRLIEERGVDALQTLIHIHAMEDRDQLLSILEENGMTQYLRQQDYQPEPRETRKNTPSSSHRDLASQFDQNHPDFLAPYVKMAEDNGWGLEYLLQNGPPTLKNALKKKTSGEESTEQGGSDNDEQVESLDLDKEQQLKLNKEVAKRRKEEKEKEEERERQLKLDQQRREQEEKLRLLQMESKQSSVRQTSLVSYFDARSPVYKANFNYIKTAEKNGWSLAKLLDNHKNLRGIVRDKKYQNLTETVDAAEEERKRKEEEERKKREAEEEERRRAEEERRRVEEERKRKEEEDKRLLELARIKAEEEKKAKEEEERKRKEEEEAKLTEDEKKKKREKEEEDRKKAEEDRKKEEEQRKKEAEDLKKKEDEEAKKIDEARKKVDEYAKNLIKLREDRIKWEKDRDEIVKQQEKVEDLKKVVTELDAKREDVKNQIHIKDRNALQADLADNQNLLLLGQLDTVDPALYDLVKLYFGPFNIQLLYGCRPGYISAHLKDKSIVGGFQTTIDNYVEEFKTDKVPAVGMGGRKTDLLQFFDTKNPNFVNIVANIRAAEDADLAFLQYYYLFGSVDVDALVLEPDRLDKAKKLYDEKEETRANLAQERLKNNDEQKKLIDKAKKDLEEAQKQLVEEELKNVDNDKKILDLGAKIVDLVKQEEEETKKIHADEAAKKVAEERAKREEDERKKREEDLKRRKAEEDALREQAERERLRLEAERLKREAEEADRKAAEKKARREARKEAKRELRRKAKSTSLPKYQTLAQYFLPSHPKYKKYFDQIKRAQNRNLSIESLLAENPPLKEALRDTNLQSEQSSQEPDLDVSSEDSDDGKGGPPPPGAGGGGDADEAEKRRIEEERRRKHEEDERKRKEKEVALKKEEEERRKKAEEDRQKEEQRIDEEKRAEAKRKVDLARKAKEIEARQSQVESGYISEEKKALDDLWNWILQESDAIEKAEEGQSEWSFLREGDQADDLQRRKQELEQIREEYIKRSERYYSKQSGSSNQEDYSTPQGESQEDYYGFTPSGEQEDEYNSENNYRNEEESILSSQKQESIEEDDSWPEDEGFNNDFKYMADNYDLALIMDTDLSLYRDFITRLKRGGLDALVSMRELQKFMWSVTKRNKDAYLLKPGNTGRSKSKRQTERGGGQDNPPEEEKEPPKGGGGGNKGPPTPGKPDPNAKGGPKPGPKVTPPPEEIGHGIFSINSATLSGIDIALSLAKCSYDAHTIFRSSLDSSLVQLVMLWQDMFKDKSPIKFVQLPKTFPFRWLNSIAQFAIYEMYIQNGAQGASLASIEKLLAADEILPLPLSKVWNHVPESIARSMYTLYKAMVTEKPKGGFEINSTASLIYFATQLNNNSRERRSTERMPEFLHTQVWANVITYAITIAKFSFSLQRWKNSWESTSSVFYPTGTYIDDYKTLIKLTQINGATIPTAGLEILHGLWQLLLRHGALGKDIKNYEYTYNTEKNPSEEVAKIGLPLEMTLKSTAFLFHMMLHEYFDSLYSVCKEWKTFRNAVMMRVFEICKETVTNNYIPIYKNWKLDPTSTTIPTQVSFLEASEKIANLETAAEGTKEYKAGIDRLTAVLCLFLVGDKKVKLTKKSADFNGKTTPEAIIEQVNKIKKSDEVFENLDAISELPQIANATSDQVYNILTKKHYDRSGVDIDASLTNTIGYLISSEEILLKAPHDLEVVFGEWDAKSKKYENKSLAHDIQEFLTDSTLTRTTMPGALIEYNKDLNEELTFEMDSQFYTRFYNKIDSKYGIGNGGNILFSAQIADDALLKWVGAGMPSTKGTEEIGAIWEAKFEEKPLVLFTEPNRLKNLLWGYTVKKTYNDIILGNGKGDPPVAEIPFIEPPEVILKPGGSDDAEPASTSLYSAFLKNNTHNTPSVVEMPKSTATNIPVFGKTLSPFSQTTTRVATLESSRPFINIAREGTSQNFSKFKGPSTEVRPVRKGENHFTKKFT